MGDKPLRVGRFTPAPEPPVEGFVPESDVVGRAVVISWPAQRWSWLDDYRSVFAGTDRKLR